MSQPGRGTGQTQRVSKPWCVTLPRAGDTAGREQPAKSTYCSYFPPRLPAGQGDRAHLKGFKEVLSRENHVLKKLFLEVSDRKRHTASPHLAAGDSTCVLHTPRSASQQPSGLHHLIPQPQLKAAEGRRINPTFFCDSICSHESL